MTNFTLRFSAIHPNCMREMPNRSENPCLCARQMPIFVDHLGDGWLQALWDRQVGNTAIVPTLFPGVTEEPQLTA